MKFNRAFVQKLFLKKFAWPLITYTYYETFNKLEDRTFSPKTLPWLKPSKYKQTSLNWAFLFLYLETSVSRDCICKTMKGKTYLSHQIIFLPRFLHLHSSSIARPLREKRDEICSNRLKLTHSWITKYISLYLKKWFSKRYLPKRLASCYKELVTLSN